MKSITLLCLIFGLIYAQQGPLTQDFQNWNGYSNDDFVRADLGSAGSYGGRMNPSDKVRKEPVIFIHGNSDAALYFDVASTGWTQSIAYFLQKGYTTHELYATTWGDALPVNAALRTHDCATLTRLRRFVEAVIAYTNATKVDIITHSMGVTLGRKLVQGGAVTGGSCNLGPSLASKVDTFVGLAGGNYGLCNCEGGDAYVSPTCNTANGFWPGDSCGLNVLTCGETVMLYPCNDNQVTYSSYLSALNASPIKEVDDMIMYADMVWGRPTSLIRNSTGYKTYATYTHMETKDLTASDQYNMNCIRMRKTTQKFGWFDDKIIVVYTIQRCLRCARRSRINEIDNAIRW